MTCTLTTVASFLLSILALSIVGIVLIVVTVVAIAEFFRWISVVQSWLEKLTWWSRFTGWFEERGYVLILIPLLTLFGFFGYAQIRDAVFGCDACASTPCLPTQEPTDPSASRSNTDGSSP